LVFGFRPVMAYASKGEMPEEFMATVFRRAGHRARHNARCFAVGTVTDPTMSKRRIFFQYLAWIPMD
jgi:hypothetical protein